MDKDLILLGHGSGGRLSHQLLEEFIIPALSGLKREERDDAAILSVNGSRLAFTTDSFVVDPIFFSGGNIGDLAVNGTVNDLAMMGARPRFLSVAVIIEEGFDKEKLRQVLISMGQAAGRAGVVIVTGDTKVVPRGKGDKIFINTSGIGILEHELEICGRNARSGDKIIINGTIGDHGIAVLSGREGLELAAPVSSDSAPLWGLIQTLLAEAAHIHVLRDPTRGGVATTLKEIALQSQVSMTIEEELLPLNPAVKGACSILGLDPLYVANEGKVLAFVPPQWADRVLETMQRHPMGKQAAIIGEVTGTGGGNVRLKTAVGGLRMIEMLAGEQLPRIC